VSRETAFEGVVVSGRNDHAAVVVQPTLQIVKVYFQKTGWLDPFELDAGNWKFSSFPASLAARSWLNSPRRERAANRSYNYPVLRTNDRPVEQVSFYDVQEFIKKLNARTGERFRLPTEWEWEYAARAGTGTARYWDEPIGRNHANCDGCGSRWDNRQTAPVRSFTANAFGLHDMLGNVEEWTCSEYKDHYDGREKKCADRASYYSLRGGSWLNKPRFVRSARRNYGVPDHRYGSLGFRRARD
jgi:formylglycine-generating enzyme required for sulfatase activity